MFKNCLPKGTNVPTTRELSQGWANCVRAQVSSLIEIITEQNIVPTNNVLKGFEDNLSLYSRFQ